jgi:hypothetical protein
MKQGTIAILVIIVLWMLPKGPQVCGENFSQMHMANAQFASAA